MEPPATSEPAQDSSTRPASSMAPICSFQQASKPPAPDEKVMARRTLNPSAWNSSDSTSVEAGSNATQIVEVFKRRRLGQDTVQQPKHPNNFDSDSVKALFKIDPSQTSVGRAQSNDAMKATPPSMIASVRPESSHYFARLLNTNGFVPNAGDRSWLPSHGGYAGDTGNYSVHNPAYNVGSATITNASDYAFSSQPAGFVIPGLGAPLKPSALVPSDVDVEITTASPLVESGPSVAKPHLRAKVDFADAPNSPQVQPHHAASNAIAQTQQKIVPSSVLSGQSVVEQTSSAKHETQPDRAGEADLSTSAGHAPSATSQVSNLPDGDSSSSPTTAAQDLVLSHPSEPPPVWREKQTAQTFKLQHILHSRHNETFDGAYGILGGLNPDHYMMPHGSRVIALKCPNIDDILLSTQIGLWATNRNVMARIMDLHESRQNESQKTLLLWSMPGSKHFCGLAELQSFNPNLMTDFWDKDDGMIKGAMTVRWLYCKLVPFEEVRRVVEGPDKPSVAQMWNGMHYDELIGREVVQAYVEAPHTENLLARPRGDFFRKAMANSKIASGPRPTYVPSNRGGGHRYQQNSRPAGNNSFNRRGRAENNKPRHVLRSEPVSRPVSKGVQSTGPVHSTQANPASPENSEKVAEPKLHYLPILIHADGTITTAPSMQGPNIQNSDSVVQTPSISSFQSSSVLPVLPLRTPTTLCSNLPSQEHLGHRRSSSVFSNDKGGSAYEMPPPPRPSAFQQTPASNAYHSGGAPRSSPGDNRPPSDVGTWAYHGSRHDSFQQRPTQQDIAQQGFPPPGFLQQGMSLPQTPMRQVRSSYGSFGSPMESITHDTPTPRGTRHSSAYTFGNGQAMHGYRQVSSQPRTPTSGPRSARMQTPMQQQQQQEDTPHPSRGHGQLLSDGFVEQNQMWLDSLIEMRNNE